MKTELKQVAISFKTMLISLKKIKTNCDYVLATGVKINSRTKGMQKFSSNIAKKTQNFVRFVICKQKTKTNLDGNQSIHATNTSLTSNANPKSANLNPSLGFKAKTILGNKSNLLKIKYFNCKNTRHYAKDCCQLSRKKSRSGNGKG